MNKTLLIIGAGGHGKSVAEAALASKHWGKIFFVDDRWPQLESIMSFPVLGKISSIERLQGDIDAAVVAIGNNISRSKIHEELENKNIELATIIHPSAYVSPSSYIAPGSTIMAMSCIGTDARLGKSVIVNSGTIVDHDVSLGDFVHLGVGVSLAGGMCIGNRAWLQAGCSAGYGTRVEDDTVFLPGTKIIAS